MVLRKITFLMFFLAIMIITGCTTENKENQSPQSPPPSDNGQFIQNNPATASSEISKTNEQPVLKYDEKKAGIGSITIEISNTDNCDCREKDGDDQCQIKNNIPEKFTATLTIDPAPPSDEESSGFSIQNFGSEVYYFKGIGTYSVVGTSEKNSHRNDITHSFPCEGLPQAVDLKVSTKESNIVSLNSVITGEIRAMIQKMNGQYWFQISLPQGNYLATETYQRVKTFIGCSSIKPMTEENNLEEFPIGNNIETSFTVDTLSGTATYLRYPFAESIPSCDDYEGATGKITYSFDLPK